MLVNREHDIFKLLALVEQQSQNQSHSVKNETMQNQQNITFDTLEPENDWQIHFKNELK